MDELLALERLVADVPERDAAARTEVWQRLVARRRSRRPLAVGVTVAAVTAACAVLALTLRTGSVGVSTAEAACAERSGPVAACLHELADAARGAPAVPPIAYQRLISYAPPWRFRSFTVAGAQTVERWIERDIPQGAERLGDPQLVFPTPADRAAWVRAGSPSWKAMTGASPAPALARRVRNTNSLTNCNYRAQAQAVGTDAAAVGARLRAIAAAQDDVGNWGAYYYRLCIPNPLLTGEQRAAIFQALATYPAVHLLGRMTDPLGRMGVALRSTINHETLTTVYDPKTGRILADALRRPSQNGGRRWWWHAYLVDGAAAKGLLVRPG